MKRTLALVRELPKTFAEKALRSNAGVAINTKLAEDQHNFYCDVLRSILGERHVISVPARHDLADSLFVEDTCVVLRSTKHAIGISVGAPSRRPEAHDVWETLRDQCGITVHAGKNPDETLDGGDVLFTGDNDYLIGLSKRTTPSGAKRFAQLVHEFAPSCTVNYIKVPFGLHLKSLCSMCGPHALVVAAQCDDAFISDLKRKLPGVSVLQVPDSDAANCVWVQVDERSGRENALIIRKDFPISAGILRRRAKELKIPSVYECDMSEIAKADGALTCCSILVNV